MHKVKQSDFWGKRKTRVKKIMKQVRFFFVKGKKIVGPT